MPYAERLRQTQSRADQKAHASSYVEFEAIQKTFQSELPNDSVFTDVINREIEKVNSHVVACLGVLESASPASDSEFVRCSAACGSLSTFIHCNRNGLREIAKEFDENMRNATWERCTRVNMRMIETAPFCTSLLERMLNVQAGLEESVLQEHGGDSLRLLLTEVYEFTAGLSENESPHVRGTPIAPTAPRMPPLPISPLRQARGIRPASQVYYAPGQAYYAPRVPLTSRLSQRVHRSRVTDFPSVEIPPPAVEDRSQVVGSLTPLFILGRDSARRDHS